jgi:hypothetical protein
MSYLALDSAKEAQVKLYPIWALWGGIILMSLLLELECLAYRNRDKSGGLIVK